VRACEARRSFDDDGGVKRLWQRRVASKEGVSWSRRRRPGG
jgi:hypothetical protein